MTINYYKPNRVVGTSKAAGPVVVYLLEQSDTALGHSY